MTMMNYVSATPSFRARLEPAADAAGTIFVAGAFDGYALDMLKESASSGVGAVRIFVDGVERATAEEQLSTHLGDLIRRGVKVYISSSV
ncbi:MAG TPA: hypothetical protein VEC57_12895 [Candidatus Limnocylindrales bacterium]|nr:hypothetical protein [Candidatus Limnocylindrales bacterium]